MPRRKSKKLRRYQQQDRHQSDDDDVAAQTEGTGSLKRITWLQDWNQPLARFEIIADYSPTHQGVHDQLALTLAENNSFLILHLFTCHQ